MNLLSGLLIVFCLIAFVSAEGHKSTRQNFKVFRERRLNSNNLGRQDFLQNESEKDTLPTPTGVVTRSPTTTTSPTTTGSSPTTTTTGTSPTTTGTSTTTTTPSPSPTSTSVTALSNKKKENKDYLEYDQLVNTFDQEDLDDMNELHKRRRRKNRRQSSRRRQHHHQ